MRWVVVLGVLLAQTAVADAPFFSPDAALCLQHFRVGERARAEAALGPLESLPLYRVDLDVDPSMHDVQGQLELTRTVVDRPLSEVFLQLTPNAQAANRVQLSGVTVNGQSADVGDVEPSLVRVRVSPPLPPGSTLRLHARFRSHVPPIKNNPLGGLAASASEAREPTDYGAFGATGRFHSLVGVIPHEPPQKPDGSPRDGPSGLGDLASYDPANLMLSVRVPRGFEALATGLELGAVPDGAGDVRFTFAAAAVRDFPVFVARGYMSEERALKDVRVSVHFAPDHAEVAERVLGYTLSAITQLEKRLGPLPYVRFSVVEAPLQAGAGGMEFPGLITVSGNLMSGGMNYFDAMGIPPEMKEQVKELVAATSSLTQVVESTLEFTVAHEVAHQYFAMLVGSDPITEPAVDETLAQYTALLYLEWKHGKPTADAMRNGQVVGSYRLFRMMGGQDGVVDRPTSAFSTGLEYAALVYGKGPMLHEAERQVMGDEAFYAGLRRYVSTYRYRWACRDCLTRVLSREVPSEAATLQRLRHRWWLERHADEDLGSLQSMAAQMQGQPMGPDTQKLVEQMMHAFEK